MQPGVLDAVHDPRPQRESLLKRLEASGLVVRWREPRDDRAIERLGMELSELEEIRDRITARIEATRRET